MARCLHYGSGHDPLELETNPAQSLAERLGAPVQVRRLERNTEGFDVLEHLVIGPQRPSGFTSLLGGAG